ncbi:hypothetical protein VTI28DRAFT_8464 [Corynascus sepedonium]
MVGLFVLSHQVCIYPHMLLRQQHGRKIREAILRRHPRCGWSISRFVGAVNGHSPTARYLSAFLQSKLSRGQDSRPPCQGLRPADHSPGGGRLGGTGSPDVLTCLGHNSALRYPSLRRYRIVRYESKGIRHSTEDAGRLSLPRKSRVIHQLRGLPDAVVPQRPRKKRGIVCLSSTSEDIAITVFSSPKLRILSNSQ